MDPNHVLLEDSIFMTWKRAVIRLVLLPIIRTLYIFKMCYQKSLYQSEAKISKYMNRPPIETDILEPYYLNDGFTHSNIYIIPMDEPGHWYPANWGLVPSYANPDDFIKIVDIIH